MAKKRPSNTMRSSRTINRAAKTAKTAGKVTKTGKTVKKTITKTAKKSLNTPKPTKEPKIGKLRVGLYWIRDKFMFKDSKNKEITDDTKKHKYVVYHDENGKVDRVVETTHLYEEKKVDKIRGGLLKAYQFSGDEFPSGVENQYITTDVNNKPLKSVDIQEKPDKARIDEAQALSIHNFAKKKRK